MDTLNSNFTTAANMPINNLQTIKLNPLSGINSVKDVGDVSLARALAGGMAGGGISIDKVDPKNTVINGGFGSDLTRTKNPENRNAASNKGVMPEETMSETKEEVTGGKNLSFPDPPAKINIKFDFKKYSRKEVMEIATINGIGSITLPIPDNLVDYTSPQWSDTSLGYFGLLGNGISDYKNILGDMKENSKKYAAEGAAYALSRVFGSNEFTNTVKTQLGATENPWLAQAFQGIQFRNHSFSWTFFPKNVTESVRIKDIIRMFKVHSLPSFNTQTKAFFNYPDVVVPTFSGDNGFLYKFKKCVITGVSSQYTPQGTPAFFKGSNAPVAITFSISLGEMEYLMRPDYQENGDQEGFDLTQTNKNAQDLSNSAAGWLSGKGIDTFSGSSGEST